MADGRDIVLICNPTAGGRWKELASILDSDEARFVRRVVTDSIDDIAPAIVALSRRTRLLCVYGGDGTIQRVLDALHASPGVGEPPQLAFIGGGTMNVGARWCGLTHSPCTTG
jgi:diacylglycerol kinase family enzyme